MKVLFPIGSTTFQNSTTCCEASVEMQEPMGTSYIQTVTPYIAFYSGCKSVVCKEGIFIQSHSAHPEKRKHCLCLIKLGQCNLPAAALLPEHFKVFCYNSTN